MSSKDRTPHGYWKITGTGWLLRALYGSNRWRFHHRSYFSDCLKDDKPVIVACWHGHLLPLFMYFARYHYYGLAGLHRDADLISEVGERMGWQLFRGSSTDRGKEVFREIVETLTDPKAVLFMTPDGPKGPAKEPKPGVLRAAQKAGAWVVPASADSVRRWGFTNWDTFYVTQPFSRIHMVFGKPLQFAPDQEFDNGLNQLKTAMNNVENEALEIAGNHPLK